MKCTKCGSLQVNVTDSRASGTSRTVAGKVRSQTPQCVEKRWGSNFIYRKRKCMECEHKWNTVEVPVTKKGFRTRSVKW